MRISKEKPFDWFAKNFGIGGFENYTLKQVRNILTAMNLIIKTCGKIELNFIGRFLEKLSENPNIIQKFYNDLNKKQF